MAATESVRFHELFADPLRNGLTRPKAVRGQGTKMVNMGEIFAHERIGEVPMERVPLSDRERESYLLEPGDLLFARQSLVLSGAGKCSIFLGAPEPTTFESHIIRARLDRKAADPLFYFYFFRSDTGRNAIESIVEQVAAAGIRGSDLANLEVPRPPFPAQRAIAYILGTLDDKIELNRRMNEMLETMARATFQSWFMAFDPVRAKAEGCDPGLPKPIVDLFPDRFEDSELGEIPAGWKVGTLADFAELNPEIWAKNTAPDEIKYVDLANAKWGKIEETQTSLWKDAPSRAQRVLRPGDTMVGTVRPGNGSFTLVAEEGLTGSTGFAVLRPREPIYEEYIYLAATSSDNIERLSHLADGAAYPAVRPAVVLATQTVLPGEWLIKCFASAAKPMMAKIAANERESHTLAALRDTLLPKLLSGDLRIKDAERIIGGHV